MRRTHENRASRQRLGALAVVLLAFVVVLAGPSTATSVPAIEDQGTWAVRPTDGSAYDQTSNAVLVFGSEPNAPLDIQVFDGSTLRLRHRIELPGYTRTEGAQPYAWSGKQRLLYLVARKQSAATAASQLELLVIDPAPKLIRSHSIALSPGFTIRGMSLHESTGRIFFAEEALPGWARLGDALVRVSAWDVEAAAWAWPSRSLPVIGCGMLVSSVAQAAILFDAVSVTVYVPCSQTTYAPSVGLSAIAGIRVADPLRPSTRMHQVPGAFVRSESLGDAAVGRIVLVSQNAGGDTRAAWVFDTRNGVFVGSAALGKVNVVSIGLDAATGQFYAGGRASVAARGTILVGSDRGMKVPQTLSFPSVRVTPDGRRVQVSPVNGTLHVIPHGRRFAIPFQTLTTIGEPDPSSDPWYEVFRDNIEPYAELADPDPDLGTVDVEERPGTTGSIFSGDGAAHGVRVHHVAGVNGVANNVVPNPYDYGNLILGPLGLRDGNRTVWSAHIPRVQLDQRSSSADAISLQADDRTKADYSGLNDGKPWPHAPASCSDLGQGERSASSGATTVRCNLAGAETTANTSHDVQTVANVPGATIMVGSSSSSIVARRDPVAGIMLTSTALTRDITFFTPTGVVHIGQVTSVAKVRARGRVASAHADLRRSFENVSAPGYACTDACDTSTVLRVLADALGIGATVEIPRALVTATPKGARAAVMRDPWELREDVVLADQDEVQQEVPALRVSLVLDRTQRGRLVIDFAAVQATSNYTIFLLPRAGDDGPAPVGPVIAPPAFEPGPPPRLVAPVPKLLTDYLTTPGRAWAVLFALPPGNLLMVSAWLLLGLPFLVASRRRLFVRTFGRSG